MKRIKETIADVKFFWDNDPYFVFFCMVVPIVIFIITIALWLNLFTVKHEEKQEIIYSYDSFENDSDDFVFGYNSINDTCYFYIQENNMYILDEVDIEKTDTYYIDTGKPYAIIKTVTGGVFGNEFRKSVEFYFPKGIKVRQQLVR